MASKSRDIMRLFFEDRASRDFYIRGSVVWPKKVYTPRPQVKDGFALLAGQTMDTGQVWIFEEVEFLTIDNYCDPDTQAMERAGLQEFFLMCWSRYGCHAFFFSEDHQVHKRYLLQCYDNDMIQPKPVFLRTPYVEEERVRDNIVEEYIALGKLRGNQNSKLYQHLTTVSVDDEPHGVHAIRCLLAGYEANPRRNR
jgi:hypothetical protein